MYFVTEETFFGVIRCHNFTGLFVKKCGFYSYISNFHHRSQIIHGQSFNYKSSNTKCFIKIGAVDLRDARTNIQLQFYNNTQLQFYNIRDQHRNLEYGLVNDISGYTH